MQERVDRRKESAVIAQREGGGMRNDAGIPRGDAIREHIVRLSRQRAEKY